MARRALPAYTHWMDKRIPLSLQGADTADGTDGSAGPRTGGHAITGYLAVTFGVLSIIAWGIVFVPLGLIFSILALVAGRGGWGFGGLVLTMIGFLHSPVLLTMLGAGAVAKYFGLM